MRERKARQCEHGRYANDSDQGRPHEGGFPPLTTSVTPD